MRVVTLLLVAVLATSAAANETAEPETVRTVGRTTIITNADGTRTLCRPVGNQIVCYKERK